MQSPFRRARRSSPLAALSALAPLAIAGCSHFNTKGYPAVERSDVLPLVATAGDTAWVIARPPITVVGRSRARVDVPGGLTGVARGWERLFGAPPGPATVVLVELPDRGKTPAPIVLPDSLAGRTVVWVPTMRWDDGDRDRRMGGGGMVGGPGMTTGPGGPSGGGAALQLAQAWLDTRFASEPNAAAIPAWLRAGLVEALGGAEGAMGRRGRGEGERLPLDTILTRHCPAGWVPVTRWRPRPEMREDSVVAAERRDRRAREIRNARSDGERLDDFEGERGAQASCGAAFRFTSGSFLRFLLDRGGDPIAARLLQTYVGGGTLEQAVAGAPGLPQTRPELERAWRAWERDRREEQRRSVTG
jgi:hypothetical protein